MSILTLNMGLTVPIPSITPGPTFASEVSNDLYIIADHDHSNSAKVTPAGLDITSDLSFQSNNLNALRTARFTDQTSTLSGISDLNAIYSYLGNLYWNNSSGVPVQLTNGALASGGGSSGSNIWETITIAASRVISPSDIYVNINVTTSSAITVTLPAASAVGAGRYYVICDATGGAATYNISITPNGSNQINGASATKVLSSAYGSWLIRSDGVSKWQLMYFAHSGLTATALTYGTTVLNSSGLTAGSNTLTSSTLTIGSSTLSTSGIVAPAATISGASTLGTLGVTGATTLTNATVSGTLGVTGTTTLGAVTLGGTMTGGTISGATITGGSVGAASGLAQLNSSSKLTSAQRSGWYVDSGSGSTLALGDTTTSVTYITPSSYATVSLSAVAGDILIISASVGIITTAATSVYWRLAVTDGGTIYAVNASEQFIPINCPSYTFTSPGLPYTVLNTGTIILQCQVKNSNGSSSSQPSNQISGVLYRP